MDLLHHRPLATGCLVFLLSLLLAAYTNSPTKLCLGGAALLLTLILLLMRRRRRKIPWLLPICCLCLVFAMLYGYICFDRRYDMADAYGGEEVLIHAQIEELTYEGDGCFAFRAACERVNERAEKRRISALVYTKEPLKVGDRVAFYATLTPIGKTGGIPLYLRAHGVAAEATDAFGLTVTEPGKVGIKSLFTGLRKTLSNRLTAHIPGRSGQLYAALLLGEADGLDDALWRDFRRTGLTHILSLSGLHLALLVGAMNGLLHRLRLPRRAGAVGEILLVLFYMALTGFSLSITRSGLMVLIVALSLFARRQVDSLTSLALAGAAIALVSPAAMYDCGFFLSVTATFGILVRGEWRKHSPRVVQKQTLLRRFYSALTDALGVTLAANIATLPLIACYFGEFSLISPLCNLLLLPFFNLCLLLSIPGLLLAPIPFVGQALWALGELPLSTVQTLAKGRWILLSLGHPALRLVIVCAALALLLCLCLHGIRRHTVVRVGLLCLLCCALTAGAVGLHRQGVTGLAYRYEGRNEMLLLQAGHSGLLCDLSSGSHAAAKAGLSMMEEAGLVELEGYLLTHYHNRHLTAFLKIAGQTVIRRLYLPTPTNVEEERIYKSLLTLAEEADIPITRYEAYDAIPFAALTVKPHAPGMTTSSHPALALSVQTEGSYMTYFSAGYHESHMAASGAAAVAQSDSLIFGLHGGTEQGLPYYTNLSPDLHTVLTPGEGRLPPPFKALLGQRIYIAAPGKTCFLPLSC